MSWNDEPNADYGEPMRLVKLGLAAVNTTVGAFGKNVDRAVGIAREMATFSRLREKRNSRLRGTSSTLDVAIE